MKKLDKKSVFKKITQYALPGVITCIVMVIILISKGIWPFGSNRIDYFDNMQQVAPLYAHLWDWMHGKASLWFDWYTGLGTNVSMSISAFSMLSPFNLLLYLIPRNYILESISLLTVIKMVFMAVAMYALLNRRYSKLQYCMKVTFACMYAFCGYVILYGSCFTPWMDLVALFPLLIMAYDHMIETGKKLFYICMVALCFIVNYYLSAMSLVYIFLICGVRMVLVQEKKKWKDTAWNVGIGTFTGIGLSAFVLVPVLMQLSSSQRGGSGKGILSQYLGWLGSSIVTDGA
ncbi:MAG: YfhO family protein, partial [Lachnospira sp.]